MPRFEIMEKKYVILKRVESMLPPPNSDIVSLEVKFRIVESPLYNTKTEAEAVVANLGVGQYFILPMYSVKG